MSRPVDEIIANDIKKDLLEDMMIGDNDIDNSTIDFMKKDVGNHCIQLRYTGVQAQCLHMLFPQPITNFNE